MTGNQLLEAAIEPSLYGRYITNDSIKEILVRPQMQFQMRVLGSSVLGEPVYSIRVGTGKTKILMWSQMHGNESTTTKAVFDLLSQLRDGSKQSADILSEISLFIIPILN